MPLESRDLASLRDMLGALGKIRRYLDGKTPADLRADEMFQDAVIRQFTVLGEAAARVSPPTREREPGIPWRAVVGLRNVVVHQYDDVDIDELWRAAIDAAPDVERRAEALLRVLEEEEGLE